MAESFSSLGRVEAIKALFEGTGYKPFGEPLHFDGPAATAGTLMLEGVDFDLVYFPLKHLGYKAVSAVTAELYAVMVTPKVLEVTLGVSAKLDYARISELWSGIVVAAKEHGYEQLSLELRPSQNGLVISANAGGVACDKRSEAASKDLICVSGPLGAAYLGFRALEKEKKGFSEGSTPEALEKRKLLVGAYLKPEITPMLPAQLSDGKLYPSFGYVVKNGLADAILRLVRDSGLGAKVYADKIPFEGGSFDFGKELDLDPVSAAMNGGDDYRLLYVISIGMLDTLRHDFQTFDIIGHLAQPSVGAVLVTPDGVELPLSAQGWKQNTK